MLIGWRHSILANRKAIYILSRVNNHNNKSVYFWKKFWKGYWKLNRDYNLETEKRILYNVTIYIEKEEVEVGEEILTLEEQKQILIDAYINLMRIKKVQKELNEELEYQIKTTRVKLSTFGIDISELEF